MQQQLSLSARPKALDGLVGQEKTVDEIRKRMANKRWPKAWLFSGPLGTGKTTAARIMALSYQCTHQEVFGRPCLACRKNRRQFNNIEINSADLTAIDKIRDVLQSAHLSPMGSAYRVFTLDEPQRLSQAAQSLLFKYLEDTPKTTIFILCTTEPHKLLDPLRSRCASYELRGLDTDAVTLLVEKLLKFVKSDLPADRLVDALIDKGINYPRWIAEAVEKYIAEEGGTDGATKVDAAQAVDTKALTRAIIKGDWARAAEYLQQAQTPDARPIRLDVLRYLKAILLESQGVASVRNEVIVKSITGLANLPNAEDVVIMAALSAEIWKLCGLFSQYKH